MVPTPSRDSYFQLTKALISLGRTRGYILVDELNSFLPPRFAPQLHPSPDGFEFTVSGEADKSVRIERTRAQRVVLPDIERVGVDIAGAVHVDR